MVWRVRSSSEGGIAVVLVLFGLAACSGNAFESHGGSLTSDSGAATAAGGASGATSSDGGLLPNGGTSAGAGGAPSVGGSISTGGVPAGSGGTTSTSGGATSTSGDATFMSGGASGSTGGAPTSTVQLVTAYDRFCQTDADCELVSEGDVCACPTCQAAAIARSADAAWVADRKRIYCPAYGAPTACPNIACAVMLPACEGALCVARTPRYIDGSSYAASCRTDGDCNLIYTGEVCSPCRCSTAAVNGTGYAQYQKDVVGVTCTPPPAACDCMAQTHVSCQLPMTPDLGTCVVGP